MIEDEDVPNQKPIRVISAMQPMLLMSNPKEELDIIVNITIVCVVSSWESPLNNGEMVDLTRFNSFI